MNRSEILDTAKEYVTKDRATTHGSAENNFRTIAEYWTIYCDHEYVFSAHDVAAMMVLFKLARFASNPYNLDNSIDAVGYSSLMGEMAHAQRKMEQ